MQNNDSDFFSACGWLWPLEGVQAKQTASKVVTGRREAYFLEIT